MMNIKLRRLLLSQPSHRNGVWVFLHILHDLACSGTYNGEFETLNLAAITLHGLLLWVGLGWDTDHI